MTDGIQTQYQRTASCASHANSDVLSRQFCLKLFDMISMNDQKVLGLLTPLTKRCLLLISTIKIDARWVSGHVGLTASLMAEESLPAVSYK